MCTQQPSFIVFHTSYHTHTPSELKGQCARHLHPRSRDGVTHDARAIVLGVRTRFLCRHVGERRWDVGCGRALRCARSIVVEQHCGHGEVVERTRRD